jgi:hypothetical protein
MTPASYGTCHNLSPRIDTLVAVRNLAAKTILGNSNRKSSKCSPLSAATLDTDLQVSKLCNLPESRSS